MKLFILLFTLVMGNATAVSLEKYRTTPEGVASQKFVLEDKKPIFEKTSNYFDLSGKDYSIGIHSLAGNKAEFEKLMKKVAEYSEKFKAVDEFLKTKDSSFNDVAGVFGHEAIIIVDGFRVRTHSKYYAELDAIFKKLRSLKWELEKGYKVSDNLEKLMEVEQGKVMKTTPYARDLYCQKVQPPTSCTFHGGGQIYVK